jgi:hypothetical protein
MSAAAGHQRIAGARGNACAGRLVAQRDYASVTRAWSCAVEWASNVNSQGAQFRVGMASSCTTVVRTRQCF